MNAQRPLSAVEVVIEHVLMQHLPVVVHHAGHLHPAGCSCGQDPLSIGEHQTRAIAAALQASGLLKEIGSPSPDGASPNTTPKETT